MKLIKKIMSKIFYFIMLFFSICRIILYSLIYKKRISSSKFMSLYFNDLFIFFSLFNLSCTFTLATNSFKLKGFII